MGRRLPGEAVTGHKVQVQPTVDFEVVSLSQMFLQAGRRHGTSDETFYWWQLSLKQQFKQELRVTEDGSLSGRRTAEGEAEGEAAQKVSRHDAFPMGGMLLASCLHASPFK